MTTRDYPRLSIEEFGKILIESNDLDPTYVALYTMLSADILPQEALGRWLLAYLLCYHCGAASYLSQFEGEDFFKAIMVAARNEEPSPLGERWPRSKERRHWRGQQAIDSTTELWDRYGNKPEEFVRYVTWGQEKIADRHAPASFREVSDRAREHRGIGGWSAFKLVDMVDRLGLRPVQFSFDDVIVYESPLKAAENLVRARLGLPKGAQIKRSAIRDVFDYLENHFSGYAAPPLYDRPINIQEVETIICCYGSMLSGHYPLYNDIREIREGLVPWAKVSEVASFFLASMPTLPQEAKAA